VNGVRVGVKVLVVGFRGLDCILMVQRFTHDLRLKGFTKK
jgi:hypothetical protein